MERVETGFWCLSSTPEAWPAVLFMETAFPSFSYSLGMRIFQREGSSCGGLEDSCHVIEAEMTLGLDAKWFQEQDPKTAPGMGAQWPQTRRPWTPFSLYLIGLQKKTSSF